MKARHTALAVTASFLVVVGVLLVVDRETASSATPHPDAPPNPEVEIVGEHDIVGVTAATPSQITPASQGSTREPMTAAVGTLVLRSNGDAAPGSELTWTPISPTLLASTWDWDEVDTTWWTDATSRAHADLRGRVHPQPPRLEDGFGSVVWVDLPGTAPRFEVLPPERIDLGERRYELLPAAAVRVRVLDVSGEPLEGASVEQSGIDLTEAADAPGYVPLLFRRSRATGADGACAATRFPGRQALVARHGGFVSRPVVVTPERDEVTLRLSEAFTAAGTVTRPASPDIAGEIVPRITLGVRNGNLWRELGTAVSRRDGTWGPVSVPCEPGAEYRARVHGVAVVTNDMLFPAPAPGDRVVLHLDAEVGLIQWFLAFDREEGIALLDTRVTVSWEERGSTRSVSTFARPDAYLEVLGIRSGPVRAVITKPGYAAGVLTGLELPTPEPVALTVVMHPGGPVSGRVVRGGEPVPDFELSYWPSDEVVFRRTIQVHDSPDGTFHIDAVPIGPIGLVASAPGSPGSQPFQVDVTEGGLSEVEIELVPAIPGFGRVVRASDGEPVAASIVQPYVSGGGAPLTPWGAPLAVAPDGAFQGAAFREGDNRLSVGAPGLGTQMVFAKSDRGRVDFGLIELGALAELTIEIVVPLEGAYRFDVNGPIVRSTRSFERGEGGDLVGRLHDVMTGSYLVELTHPNLDTTFRKLSIKEGSNLVRFRGGSGHLSVTVRDRLEGRHELAIEMYDENGEWEWYATNLTQRGTAQMPGLPAGDARIYLRRSDEEIASATARIVAGQETHVELAIGNTDLLLHVVDADGDPVIGATVRLLGTDVVRERHGGLTNAKGAFTFRSLGRGRYLLHVNHLSLGLMPDVEIDVNTDGKMEREVVLDGRATLELQVLDDDVVLPGITCRLLNSLGEDLTPPVLTNDEGRTQLPRLTPGIYRLSVTGAGTWPVELEVDVQTGAGLRSIQVRRLGDLKLRIVNADGVPVAAVDVDLVFAETQEDVRSWIEAGRVNSSAGLTTNNHGEIVVEGLPRGSYTWQAGESQGVLLVEPEKESLALLAVQ